MLSKFELLGRNKIFFTKMENSELKINFKRKIFKRNEKMGFKIILFSFMIEIKILLSKFEFKIKIKIALSN